MTKRPPKDDDDWLNEPASVPIRNLTKRELASATGLTIKNIDGLLMRGLPNLRARSNRGGARFDLPAVFGWITKAASGSVAAKDAVALRGAEARAGLKEIELAEASGRVVSIEAVTDALGERLALVRSRIAAMPGRLAVKLAAEKDAAAVERAIKVETSAALGELADGFKPQVPK